MDLLPMPVASAAPPEVSVVIPCRTEAATVGACVRDARAALERGSYHGEVVVCDNASTDGSAAISDAAGARVVRPPIRGYGEIKPGALDGVHRHFLEPIQTYLSRRFLRVTKQHASVSAPRALAGSLPPDAVVTSGHPAIALYAARDWRVLPGADLSAILRYADAAGSEWVVISRFYPALTSAPRPRRNTP
jgi:glycosyltransferase involved in cell wall biosynthesis